MSDFDDLVKGIAARARRLGSDDCQVYVIFSGYGSLHWRAAVTLLPKRTKGRHVTTWAATPLQALRLLDQKTGAMESDATQ